jgi:hypothetical protein
MELRAGGPLESESGVSHPFRSTRLKVPFSSVQKKPRNWTELSTELIESDGKHSIQMREVHLHETQSNRTGNKGMD